MTKLIKEAIADANAVQSVAEERAKEMLIKEFSPKIKSMLASVINEEGVSTGSDQPGGYKPEEDQDAIGADTSTSAEDINKKGAGPDNLAEEDELDVDAEEEPVVESDDNDEDDEEKIEENDDIPPVEGDEDDVLEIVDDEVPAEEEPVVPPVEEEEPAIPPAEDDDELTPDQVMEAYKAIRRRAVKLNKENKVLREAVNTLSKKFHKIDLFNAKLAYAFKLMTQPGLNRNTKKQIAETFDAARSVRETKLIYKTLKNALGQTVRVQKPLANKNVKSVISESTKPASGINRMSELAGL